jgi:hypothetical protein
VPSAQIVFCAGQVILSLIDVINIVSFNLKYNYEFSSSSQFLLLFHKIITLFAAARRGCCLIIIRRIEFFNRYRRGRWPLDLGLDDVDSLERLGGHLSTRE